MKIEDKLNELYIKYEKYENKYFEGELSLQDIKEYRKQFKKDIKSLSIDTTKEKIN